MELEIMGVGATLIQDIDYERIDRNGSMINVILRKGTLLVVDPAENIGFLHGDHFDLSVDEYKIALC